MHADFGKMGAYTQGGEDALASQSTRPKSNPKETPIRIKERIIEVWKGTGKCTKKIHWQLAKEGIRIDARTIDKILKAEGLVRKYRVKRVKYQYIKTQRQPGELVEIDVK